MFTEDSLPLSTIAWNALYRCIWLYLDNPLVSLVQNYRSKSETANNYRRWPKFSPFPVFFDVSGSAFWALDFFRRFVGYFSPFQNRQHTCKMTRMQKLFGGRRTCRQQQFLKRQQFCTHWKTQVFVCWIFLDKLGYDISLSVSCFRTAQLRIPWTIENSSLFASLASPVVPPRRRAPRRGQAPRGQRPAQRADDADCGAQRSDPELPDFPTICFSSFFFGLDENHPSFSFLFWFLLGIANFWPKDRLLVSENLIIFFWYYLMFYLLGFGIRSLQKILKSGVWNSKKNNSLRIWPRMIPIEVETNRFLGWLDHVALFENGIYHKKCPRNTNENDCTNLYIPPNVGPMSTSISDKPMCSLFIGRRFASWGHHAVSGASDHFNIPARCHIFEAWGYLQCLLGRLARNDPGVVHIICSHEKTS